MEKAEVKLMVKEVLQEDVIPQIMELLRTTEDRLTGYRNELQSAKIRCEAYEKRIHELEKMCERLQGKYDALHDKYDRIVEKSIDKTGVGSRADVKVNL